MKIIIDTSEQLKVRIATQKGQYMEESVKNRSQRILPLLREVLLKEELTFADISAIEVKTGPGSFTGLRVGVAIAQTLAWSLRVPVNGLDLEKEKSVPIRYL